MADALMADPAAALMSLAQLGRAMRDAQADVAAEARYRKLVRHDNRICDREPAVSAARLKAEALAREFDRRVAAILDGVRA